MPGIAPGTGDTATTGSSPCLLGIMELVLRADGTEQVANSAVLLTTPNQQQRPRSDRNSFHPGGTGSLQTQGGAATTAHLMKGSITTCRGHQSFKARLTERAAGQV